MSASEMVSVSDRLDRLEQRVNGLRRWVILSSALAGVAALLFFCGFGVAILSLLGGFGTPPVRQVGEPVTEETRLEVGTRVVALWQNSWWDAEVIAVHPDGRVTVHYVGWDSRWDEVVPRARLRLPLRPTGGGNQ